MEVSRRRLIQAGLGGTALLGLGGIGFALQSSLLRLPAEPLKALDIQSFSILAAIVDRITPRGELFPKPADLGVAEKVDALLATLHPGDVRDFKNGLMLIENPIAGFLLDGRLKTFTASSPEAQDRALQSVRTSRIPVRRSIYRAIYGLVSGAYWSSPETYRACGYGGPPEFGSGMINEPSRAPISRRPSEPVGPLGSSVFESPSSGKDDQP